MQGGREGGRQRWEGVREGVRRSLEIRPTWM